MFDGIGRYNMEQVKRNVNISEGKCWPFKENYDVMYDLLISTHALAMATVTSATSSPHFLGTVLIAARITEQGIFQKLICLSVILLYLEWPHDWFWK